MIECLISNKLFLLNARWNFMEFWIISGNPAFKSEKSWNEVKSIGADFRIKKEETS